MPTQGGRQSPVVQASLCVVPCWSPPSPWLGFRVCEMDLIGSTHVTGLRGKFKDIIGTESAQNLARVSGISGTMAICLMAAQRIFSRSRQGELRSAPAHPGPSCPGRKGVSPGGAGLPGGTVERRSRQLCAFGRRCYVGLELRDTAWHPSPR